MGDFSRTYKGQLTDQELMHFWWQAKAAGRSRSILFDMPEPDEQGFAQWVRRPDIHFWLVAYKGVTMGAYYLTQMQGKSAHIHFITLPCTTHRTANRRPVSLAAALFGLGSSLWEPSASSYKLDTIIGVTPMSNTAAVKFIQRCGAVECGVLPGGCYFHDTGENVPALLTVFNRASVPDWTAKL